MAVTASLSLVVATNGAAVIGWRKAYASGGPEEAVRAAEREARARLEAEKAATLFAAEQVERTAAIAAEKKAERDARYAARKTDKKVRRRGH